MNTATGWRTRLQPHIALKSPSGQQFTAAWRGGERTKEKHVGEFSFPKVDGSVVQDLGSKGDRYPLTFYFTGPLHDVESERFWKACNERGAWVVDHPTKGRKRLQFLHVEEDIQPVESGNLTLYKCDTLEALNERPVEQYTSAFIEVQVENAKIKAASQFKKAVKIDKPGLLAQFKAAIDAVKSKVQESLGPIQKQLAEVNEAANSVQRGISDALNSSVLSVVSLAGQVQSLVELPGMVTNDIGARFDYYTQLIDSVGSSIIAGSSPAVRNSIATAELVLTGAITSMAKAVSNPDAIGVSNQVAAVAFAEKMLAAMSTVTSVLDVGQSAFADSPISDQHISQSEAYADLVLLVSTTAQHLLQQSFTLATARRFTLGRERAPYEIATTEGMDLDAFLSANALKGRDIILLPAGRQVVVYR